MNPDTSQPFTLNRADGSIIEFPLLTPSDRIAFRNAFRMSRKLALMQNLRITGITGADALKHLNDFDARRLAERDVEQWVLEPEGAAEALLLSVQHVNAAADDAAVDAYGLSDDERFDVAAGVLGLKVTWAPAEGDKPGEKKPDPTTAGTARTGAEPQPSSGVTAA